MADIRARRLARLARRRPYRQMPDLPGMTKRRRKLGYFRWFPRYGYYSCLIRRKPRYDPDVDAEPKRELKPRPPYRRNRKAYDRGRERDEFAAIMRETVL